MSSATAALPVCLDPLAGDGRLQTFEDALTRDEREGRTDRLVYLQCEIAHLRAALGVPAAVRGVAA